MARTSAHQPPTEDLVVDLARGYRWTARRHEAVPYNYTQAAPAGAMTTTALDMSRFMLALLDDGALNDTRILSPDSVRRMFEPQDVPHPRRPGWAYGFSPLLTRGRWLVYRGGTLGDQAAMVLLAPADNLGIFIASNSLPGLGDFLFEPMMAHLAGPPVPPPPPQPLPDAARRAPRFAGAFRRYQQVRNEMTRLRALTPMSQGRVTVDDGGVIRWQGRQWVEVDPLVFRRVDSEDYILFRENERGQITGVDNYERIGWLEQVPLHLAIVACSVVTFAAYLGMQGVRSLRRRTSRSEGRTARICAVAAAAINVMFVVWLVASFRELGAITPLPLSTLTLLWLPIISLALTALLPAFAFTVWWEQWWTRGERVAYSTLAVFAIAFMTFLNYWKLLGIRY
jgi:hypothetical protein